MPERKLKTLIAGNEVSVTDVPFKSLPDAPEQAFEYQLEDGSIVRVRYSTVSIRRVDGQFDAEGRPVYLVNSGTSSAVIEAGEKVRKPANGTTAKPDRTH